MVWTYSRKGDSLLKNNSWSIPHGSPSPHRAICPHTHPWPPQPLFSICSKPEGPRLFFEPKLSHTNRSLTSYLLALEDGTEYPEKFAFKLQTPANKPEESIRRDRLLFSSEKKCAYSAARTEILRTFAKLRKATISLVTSVHPSDCPQGTTLFPLDRYSWNVAFEHFSKTCRKNSISLNWDKNV
jgi:hypothetical protein